MANHLRRQIREAAATTLTSLVTSGANVFQSRTHELQEASLPALRVYTNNEPVEAKTIASARGRTLEHELELVVEACAKASTSLDDTLDLMCQEVEVALAANQGLGVGVKSITLKGTEIEMEGEAEKEVGVARMTFICLYYTAQGAPDAAL